MAFSSADVDAIDRALVDLATGVKAVSVRFADGRTVQYMQADLDKLMKLRAFIAGQVATSTDPANAPGAATYAEWECG